MSTVQIYTVEGRTRFPIDMLRYDQSSPRHEVDSSKIAESSSGRHTMKGGGKLQIELIRIVVEESDEPSAGRWQSYGWKVVEIDTFKV